SGTLAGLISNPTPGGGTATFSFNVLNPVPVVTSFTPTSALAGTQSVSLDVRGSNFRPDSQVTVEGTAISTSFVSATQLTAVIPDGVLRRWGDVPIGVYNQPPGGGSAAGGTFRINSPVPTLTSMSPASAFVQLNPVNVNLLGTGFEATSQVSVDGTRLDKI